MTWRGAVAMSLGVAVLAHVTLAVVPVRVPRRRPGSVLGVGVIRAQ